MPRPSRLLPALALAALPPAAAAQESPAPAGPDRVITVTGEGWVDAKPDLAMASLGVTHQADTAGEAMALMAQGMTAVLGTLAEAGVAPADLQTGQLTLEPAYNYDTGSPYPPVTGFIATQTVDVRLRDVTELGPVLDAVTAEGANRVNGVYFLLDDQAAALEEARAEAVADARARAATYAEAAGLTLGGILRIAEGSSFGGPQPLYDGRDAQQEAAATPVAPGQVTVSALITVTFAVE